MSLPDGVIRERTRQYGITDDPFVGLAGSFQYAENLNVFDDPRGIKLTTNWRKSSSYKSCKLVSAGNYLIRIPESGNVQRVDPASRPNGTTIWTISTSMIPYDAVIFNDAVAVIAHKSNNIAQVFFYDIKWWPQHDSIPVDNTWDTPIIMWINTPSYCSCIANFNNSMLLVGNGNYLRWYNPADDTWSVYASWWKVLKEYSGNCDIVDISPKADYVEIFIEDGYWNTKIHYYPWIFDMEDSGLMKSVNLPNTRIQRVYPHMTKEMVAISLDGSNNNVSLREILWYETYPVMRSHRAGLSPLDVQHKLGFFTWPCSEDMAFYDGRAYIADVEGIWEFNRYHPDKMPVGNLRWKFNDESDNQTPKWLAVAKDFIFASYDDWEYCARIYDTANPAGYAEQGTLVSRAIETEYGGEFTKELVKWMVQFEMNNLTTWNGKIDIYACWNRERNSLDDTAWKHIARITQSDADFWSASSGWWYSVWTCVHRFDNGWDYTFMQDRQVIEYKVVITRWSEEDASPVLRSLLFDYRVKEKTNYF